jgi:oligopeptide transport system substrate-binding protein
MKRAVILAVIVVTVMAGLPTSLVFAHEANVTLTSVLRQNEPITWYGVAANEVSTFDPQRAEDTDSGNAIENLFLALTNNDPMVPGNLLPELATSWEVSADGTQWTFTLRNDVPWVDWDPVTDTATAVRMVTAFDVEYGFKRACDPRLGAYYTTVADKVILGCNEVSTKPMEEVTDADYDLVQVQALDDTTLVVNLQFAAGYFFSMTPLMMFRPVPQEVIAEYGDNWTDVDNILVNGPFVLDEYVRGVRRVYMTNPLMPADLRGPGNVERLVFTVVEDAGTTFSLWLDGQIETSGVPAAEIQSVLTDSAYEGLLTQTSGGSVAYYSFGHHKPPFDNVYARRAFSAIIDREAFITEVRQGRGIPMIHLTPPGMFGAVPINEVGVGYNPDYAREQLALAGYPNCEGMPAIEYASPGVGGWGEFLVAAAERELGCSPDIFTLETMDWTVFLEMIDPQSAPEDVPNIWGGSGWLPDYGDANNWVGDVLSCEAENSFRRPCGEVDDMIRQAAREADPDTRIELYYRIEEMFFGPEGEFPIIPVFSSLLMTLKQPWADAPLATDALFGGQHYDWRSIDPVAQAAGR